MIHWCPMDSTVLTRMYNVSPDGKNSIMAVNTKGAFLCCKAVVDYLRGQGGGSIVNISSIAGKQGAPNMSAYCASKHALIGLTRCLAKELAGDNIRVNAVCPGIVRTAMWEYLIDVRKAPDETPDAFFDRFIEQMVPLGKSPARRPR